mmetsp:Transcript_27509/g.30443  ORF Transcript_27509/g.30443 Transcript_27509/m.30443 type:complete len:122 (-) Transcript_27509:9-374(-)
MINDNDGSSTSKRNNLQHSSLQRQLLLPRNSRRGLFRFKSEPVLKVDVNTTPDPSSYDNSSNNSQHMISKTLTPTTSRCSISLQLPSSQEENDQDDSILLPTYRNILILIITKSMIVVCHC